MEKLAIGIDLGGTNLKGVLLNEQGKGNHITRIPTEAQKGGVQVLKNILRLTEMLLEKVRPDQEVLGVGIGTPGYVSEDGTVYGAENLPGWKGTQIYTPIKEKFGLPALAANDVTVMALAESKYGAGRGVNNLVCYALGTGIGGGIVIDGCLYKGTHGMAGELGHIVVQTDGIPCNCGQRGCVEQYASATGIANFARKLATKYCCSNNTPFVAEANKDLSKVTSKMVYDYVHHNDPIAVQVHETTCDMMARAIGTTLNTLSPDRVVLGGGVMMAGQIIVDTVSRFVPQYCWPSIWKLCDIVLAELGEDAGVFGAAAMIFESFSSK